jgi:hypothetical protein
MLIQDLHTVFAGPDLEEAVERQIRERTWGRIQRLEVEQRGGRLVVHGHSPSYYVKQLALLAVRELDDSMPVELDIQVLDTDRCSP